MIAIKTVIPFPALATIQITQRNSGNTGLISRRWFEEGEIVTGTYNKVYDGDSGIKLLVDGEWFYFHSHQYKLIETKEYETTRESDTRPNS